MIDTFGQRLPRRHACWSHAHWAGGSTCCCTTLRAHVCLTSLILLLQVGLVLDVVLVTLIAPVAQPGRKTAQAGAIGEGCQAVKLKRYLGGLRSLSSPPHTWRVALCTPARLHSFPSLQ